MTSATQEAYERLLADAEARSRRLNDPCKHLTRCADMACNYRMEDAATADQSRYTRASRAH